MKAKLLTIATIGITAFYFLSPSDSKKENTLKENVIVNEKVSKNVTEKHPPKRTLPAVKIDLQPNALRPAKKQIVTSKQTQQDIVTVEPTALMTRQDVNPVDWSSPEAKKELELFEEHKQELSEGMLEMVENYEAKYGESPMQNIEKFHRFFVSEGGMEKLY